MTLKEFGETLSMLMLKNDAITRNIIFNGKLCNEEINDSFDTMYNIEFENLYRNTRLMFRFDKPQKEDDDGLILIMNIGKFSIIDLYTALIEMGYIRIFLRCLCYDRNRGFMHTAVIMSIIDDMLFMDNSEGLKTILNTDFVKICEEDDRISHNLLSRYDEEGYPIYNALKYDKKFLCDMVEQYSESIKSMPILLEYIKDHYDDEGDITL